MPTEGWLQGHKGHAVLVYKRVAFILLFSRVRTKVLASGGQEDEHVGKSRCASDI